MRRSNVNDETAETPITDEPNRRPGWWRRIVETLDATVTTKVKHLLGTVAVAFIVVGLVFNAIQNNSDADRAGDARTASLLSYTADVRAYDAQVSLYEGCLSKVATRVIVRQKLIDQNESTLAVATALRRVVELVDFSIVIDPTLATALYAEIDDAIATVNKNRAAIDTDYAEYPANECPASPPTPPKVPENIADLIPPDGEPPVASDG